MPKAQKIFIWSSSTAVFIITLIFFGMPILNYVAMKKCARALKEASEVFNESIECYRNSIKQLEEDREETYAKLKIAEDLNNDSSIKFWKEHIEFDTCMIEDNKELIQFTENSLKKAKMAKKMADVYFNNWGFLIYWHCKFN